MGYRYSAAEGAVLLAAMIVFLALMGDMVSIMPVATSGLCGVLMGYMLKAKRPAVEIVKNGFAVALVSLVGVFGVYKGFFHMNILQDFVDALPKFVQSSMDAYRSMGIGGQDLSTLKTMLESAMNFIGMSLPFDIILYSGAVSLIGFLATEAVLKNEDISRLKPFSEWKVSRNLSLLLIAVWLIELAFRTNNTVYMVTLNAVLTLLAIFAVDGYSLLAFYMKKLGMKSWLQILTVIMSIYISVFAFIVIGAGVLDASFDFRHLGKGAS